MAKNILLVGHTGMVGSAIFREAEAKGFHVTTASRKTGLDINDSAALTKALEGKDALVVSVPPPRDPNASAPVPLTTTLAGVLSAIRHVAKSNPNIRLLWVGGAGSLLLPNNIALVDTPDFPKLYYSEAKQQHEVLEKLRNEASDVNWFYFSPSIEIAPAEKTGKYKIGTDDHLLRNETGKSHITTGDFAEILVHELQTNAYNRKRITAVGL